MNKKCPNCRLINFPNASNCKRCGVYLSEISIASEKPATSLKAQIVRRAVICLAVCVFCLAGFYLSLVFSAKSLNYTEKQTVAEAVSILREKGFADEVFMLDYLTVFRANDNWLNASTRLEDAYAATNFPFEIMTIYPEFFDHTSDATERAAILLHEAQHLHGADEKQAYAFVWNHRRQLGWTKENYGHSPLWLNVRKQTKEFAPELFNCPANDYDDCTENE